MLRARVRQREESGLGSIEFIDEGHKRTCVIRQVIQRSIIRHLVPEVPGSLTQIIDVTTGIRDSPMVLGECRFERSRFQQQGISGFMLTATEFPCCALKQLTDSLVSTPLRCETPMRSGGT